MVHLGKKVQNSIQYNDTPLILYYRHRLDGLENGRECLVSHRIALMYRLINEAIFQLSADSLQTADDQGRYSIFCSVFRKC